MADITSNLSAYYRADTADVVSGVLADASGHGLSATLIGSPTLVTGQVGQALSLNGASQYGSVGNVLSLSGDATWAAWVKPTSVASAFANIIGKRDASGFQWQFRLASGKLSMLLAGSVAGATTLTANVWTHVAAVVASGSVTLYVNGVSDGTGSQSYGAGTSATVGLGALGDGSTHFFPGLLDEVRVYARALSAGDIAALVAYAGGVPTAVLAALQEPGAIG